jgi:hypothetical protein
MLTLGREICFGCRKPKRRKQWLCRQCEQSIRRNINRKRKVTKR